MCIDICVDVCMFIIFIIILHSRSVVLTSEYKILQDIGKQTSAHKRKAK